MTEKLPPDQEQALALLKERLASRSGNTDALDLSNIGLMSIPEALFDASWVRYLVLRNNHLSELPASIERMPSLASIDLSDNALTEVPQAVQSLPALWHLGLDGNSLRELPAWLTELASLTYIDARRNLLRSIPGVLLQSCIEHLDVSDNAIESVDPAGCLDPAAFRQEKRGHDVGEDDLTFLRVSRNRLTRIPEHFFQDMHLLDLSDNPLCELPSDWGGMTLCNLVVAGIGIDRLPDLAFGDSFWTLDISRNRFSELPPAIRAQRELKTLIASRNGLRAVPAWLNELTHLADLDLSENALTGWPVNLCDFPSLAHLDLSRNPLGELPREMRRLVSLRELVLSDGASGLSSRITLARKDYDVFISHASEDRPSVALPLRDELARAGLKVWLDTQEIEAGDSVRASIDEGIRLSQAAVAIVSRAYMKKRWTTFELNALFHKEGRLIPLWHDVSRDEVARWSPLLVDRHALDTSGGIAAVADRIRRVLLFSRNHETRLSMGLAARLAGALEEEACAPAVAMLLRCNPEIFSRAGLRGEVRLGPEGPIPCLCVSEPRSDGAAGALVALASPTDSPFSEEIEAHLTWLAAAPFGRVLQRILVCGRRADLQREQARLRQLNDHSRRVTVRSYDWLLDACAQVDVA